MNEHKFLKLNSRETITLIPWNKITVIDWNFHDNTMQLRFIDGNQRWCTGILDGEYHNIYEWYTNPCHPKAIQDVTITDVEDSDA